MRSSAIAIVLAGALVAVADPQFYEASRASIGAEGVNPGANNEAQAGAGPSAAETPPAGNPLWAIPVSKLSATRDRPLFSPSRLPRTPAVAAAPEPLPVAAATPAPPETPSFTLVGTIIGETSRIAILFDETSKTATGVREGEQTAGWTLRSVDARSAVMEGNSRLVTLDLPEPTAEGSPAPQPSVMRNMPRFVKGGGPLRRPD
jgi:hypothetical protein